MDFNNLSIGQLSTFDVTYLDANLKKLSLDLQLKIPYLATDGDYNLDGYVSYFPVYGKDYMHMKLNNVTINAHAKVTSLQSVCLF